MKSIDNDPFDSAVVLNRPFILLICSLFAACPVVAEQFQIYENPNWGFSVKMPRSIHYAMDRPPNPNHGFRIIVSKESFVWVNGGSTDDRSLNEAAGTEVSFWLQQNCKIAMRRDTLLAKRPAIEVSLHCVAGGEKEVSTRVHLIVAFASPSRIGSVAYTIGMTSLDNEQSYDVVKPTFDIVIDGFQFHALKGSPISRHRSSSE